MMKLSPGILFSAFRFLIQIKNEKIRFSSFVNNLTHYEGVLVKHLIDVCCKCKWIEINGSNFENGINSEKILEIGVFNDKVKQIMIKDFIIETKPVWGPLIVKGRNELVPFLDTDMQMCLYDAKLMSKPITQDCISWWDDIAIMMLSEKDAKHLQVGRKGEMLTMKFEHDRTGKPPELKAIESNVLGYDILSFVSTLDQSSLLIEVKTSESTIREAKAHITRNEWEVAMSSRNYVFHFWCIHSLPTLAVLTVDQLIENIPNDSGLGKWKEAEIPFNAYRSYFVEYIMK